MSPPDGASIRGIPSVTAWAPRGLINFIGCITLALNLFFKYYSLVLRNFILAASNESNMTKLVDGQRQ